jgi:hypothetical protein
MRIYGWRDLKWKDDRLMVDGRWSGARIVPDPVWPKMFRVEYPKGVLSDMVNRTRAKDAAAHLVLSQLNAAPRNADGASAHASAELPGWLVALTAQRGPASPSSSCSNC